MSRVRLELTMELLSDAIFGSGHSVPGGEDIDVCRDEQDYPYLRGSTLKGLLRESTADYLGWTGLDQTQQAELLNILFGNQVLGPREDSRRLHLTSMTLLDPPDVSEECYMSHAFTAIEDGIAKDKSLHQAVAICRGQRFHGTIYCDSQDADLLTNALKCIKWAGTMRSRGFGQVEISVKCVPDTEEAPEIAPTGCIHYQIHNLLPLLITDMGHSSPSLSETRTFIPGSAIRGMVLTTLASQESELFEKYKDALLEDVSFLDAVPFLPPVTEETGRPAAVLPSIRGFYERKDESGFTSILKNEDLGAGMKRAKMGSFCSIEGDTVYFWSAQISSNTRIQRDTGAGQDSNLFSTHCLSAGQDFDGYILLRDPELAPVVARALTPTVWLGADRFEGYGQCAVHVETADRPAWADRYGYSDGDTPEETIYLLALSPLTMLNEWGDPVGLDDASLAQALGVDRVQLEVCSTAMSEYGSYNRTWKCREPSTRMYDRGSIFRLRCSPAPTAAALQAVQRTGLGVRTSEGYGQVLFLRNDLFLNISKKQKLERKISSSRDSINELRRKRYQWLTQNQRHPALGGEGRDGLSASQLGIIQSYCMKARLTGDISQLEQFLQKTVERHTRQGSDTYSAVRDFLKDMLDLRTPMSKILGYPCPDSMERSLSARLDLIIQLFDHYRKGDAV